MATRLSKFDPYVQWLGIKAAERPLNAYLLLGLKMFDGDGSRIRAALHRRREMLSFHRETEPQIWSALDKELAHAERVLTDSEERAVYDAMLRRQHSLADALRSLHSDERATLTCVGCQTESPGGRRYCAGCGKSLWDICSACNTPSPVAEKFCGACGTDRVESLERARQEAAAGLEQAKALIAQQQWSAGLQHAHRTACLTDPRLEELAGQAADLWRGWRDSWRTHQADTARLEQVAIQCHQQGDRNRALQIIEQIPEALRSPTVLQIQQRVQHERDELERLEAELRSGVAEKRYVELGRIVDRLLELDARHAGASKVAEQLSAILVASARKRLAAGDHDKAVTMLRAMPCRHRDSDEYRRIESEMEERRWLVDHVRYALEVDAGLEHAAARLVQTAPDAPAFPSWLRQLKSGKTTDRSPRVVPWNPSRPAQSVVGPPVEHWRGPRRLVCDSATGSAKADLGVLATAIGLALQGLNEGPCDINLAGSRKSLIPGFGVSKKAEAAWGIDLGAASIKAVLLRRRDGEVVVANAVIVETQESASRTRSDADGFGTLESALPVLFAKTPWGKGERICVSLPFGTLTKVVDLPAAPEKRLREVMQFETRRAVPIALEDLAWDYALLPQTDPDTPGRRGVLVAAKRSIVDSLLARWQTAGGPRIDILQDGGLALHSFLQFELAGDPEPVGVLDMGATRTTYLVTSPSGFWSRSLPASGRALTERLARENQLTLEQAEQVKREPWRVTSLHKVYRTIEPGVHDLLHDVRRSLAMLQREAPQLADHRLFLLGGAARLHGLLRYFWFEQRQGFDS